jgi:hypothetical protein
MGANGRERHRAKQSKGRKQQQLTDIAGWAAGTAAADLAELGVHSTLPSAS